MKRSLLLMCLLFACTFVFSQKSSETIPQDNNPLLQNNATVYFIGIDTGVSDNFTKIRETLGRSKGIVVQSYCNRNNIIELTFDKDVYKELRSVFDRIENEFEEALCYHMRHYTDESYKKMCSSELLKRNMGGTE